MLDVKLKEAPVGYDVHITRKTDWSAEDAAAIGMSTSPIEVRPLARTVQVTDDELSVGLADGRVIIVPLVWFPRLANASAAARNKWELLGDGEGIHWPDVDEDLSVEGLLAGHRAKAMTAYPDNDK